MTLNLPVSVDSLLPLISILSPSSLLLPNLAPHPSLVPSAPLNVTYENLTATSIHVYWFTPAEPNGIIDNYTVEYTNIPTNETLCRDGIVPTFVNITGLMEYQPYTVVVYAYTDNGRGEGSDPLMVLTAEHCKLRCKGACSVSIKLDFLLPSRKVRDDLA